MSVKTIFDILFHKFEDMGWDHIKYSFYGFFIFDNRPHKIKYMGLDINYIFYGNSYIRYSYLELRIYGIFMA